MASAKAITGVDGHVAYTLLLRSWGLFGGALSILLIPHFLTPVEQGYYFTFASILALQIFFELGIGQVVIQIVAHEAAYLRQNENGHYVGETEALSRIATLRSLLRRWYLWAALLFAIIVCAVGLAFFWSGELRWTNWAPAWIALVLASALNFFFSGKLAMVEGFGLVRDVTRIRLLQSIMGYILLWAGLVAGAGLWVVACVPFAAAVGSYLWLRVSRAVQVSEIHTPHPPARPIEWKRDILPLQWRTAVSWISGYLTLQLFTPLIFQLGGAVEAGKQGLAMTVFSAISVIGISWVNAKAPNCAMLVARGESEELLRLFKSVAWRSLAMTVALSAAVTLGAAVSLSLNLPIMSRIASLPVLVCLAWVTIVNCVIFASAIFMRAHREEPMVAMSIVSSVSICLVAWLCSPFGALPMMKGYAAVSTMLSLPWTLWILRGYLARHRNHSASSSAAPRF
jgi:hypothetical protein